MDPLRRAMERETIKAPRQGKKNTEVGGITWEEQNSGSFSVTDRKDEGMNKIRSNKRLPQETVA